MQHAIFSVFDEKAHAYVIPFCFVNTQVAKRAFRNSINDKNHMFGQNPYDFTLFKIATFEDTTGELRPTKLSLGNGVEYIEHELEDTQQQLQLTKE